MADYFFFGTLRHPPLLRVVLGHAATGEPARLAGHAVRQAMDGAFPVLVVAPDAGAEGILVRGIGLEDIARLNHYEGGFGCDIVDRVVDSADGPVTARVCVPRPGLWTAGPPWVLADWQAHWADVVTETARDVMALHGTVPAEAVLARYPQMLVRGASRLRARAATPTALRHDEGPGDVQVLERRTPYARFFAVEEYELTHRRFDGGQCKPILRAAFIACDAVTVLPYDPRRDRVLLVEQFRAGALARGDVQCWQLEAVAGRVDAGEPPEETARREAVEEAGLDLGPLLPVSQYYTSIGAVSEYIYSYVAPCDLPDGLAGTHGVEEEGEDIRTHVIAFDRLMELVASGEISNAPLIITALWLQRERPSLRGALQV